MKYLKTLIIFSAVLLIPCIAKSEVIETWECFAPNGNEAVIIAQINAGGKSGKIKLTEITYDTFVYSGALFRRWDFGLNESNDAYNYALVIKSDGKGLYFDFTQGYTAEPSQRFQCKMQ